MVDISQTSWSEVDSSNDSTPPDGWPSGTMKPSEVEPAARAIMGAVKRFWNRVNATVTAGGSATAYTYTPSNTSFPASYVTGEIYAATFSTSNTTTSPTININAIGAKNLVNQAGDALGVGAVNGIHLVAYDGTDVRVLNPVSISGPSSSTNGNVPKWNGTSGSILADGYGVGTSANDLVQLDANGKISSTILKRPTRTVLTSGSGTYTTPSGVAYINVRMVGGGGGGGGGGGSGATAGGAGGNTTFGTSLLAANGGAGGVASDGGSAAGGTASGGDINLSGADGTTAINCSGASIQPFGPPGASSVFGGAGKGGDNVGNATAAKVNTGSGGGAGAGQSGNVSGMGGAAGGYCEKLINTPDATYAYAVGAAGSAGAGGTGGNAAGAGGSGIIIIDEFYN